MLKSEICILHENCDIVLFCRRPICLSDVVKDLIVRGKGQGLENWSSRILKDKDKDLKDKGKGFPRGQQHWESGFTQLLTYTVIIIINK